MKVTAQERQPDLLARGGIKRCKISREERKQQHKRKPAETAVALHNPRGRLDATLHHPLRELAPEPNLDATSRHTYSSELANSGCQCRTTSQGERGVKRNNRKCGSLPQESWRPLLLWVRLTRHQASERVVEVRRKLPSSEKNAEERVATRQVLLAADAAAFPEEHAASDQRRLAHSADGPSRG